MHNRPLTLFAIGVVAVMAVVATIAEARLPAGTRLPVHWNAAGEADRFAETGRALFMPVILAAGSSLLFALLPRIEPLQDRMAGSTPLLDTVWTELLVLMLLIQASIAAPAFDIVLPPTLPMAGVGALLIVIGNALPKSRPGFFVGIRTPWTLTDTDNWIATHRLGAWTMMAGGATIVAAALLPIGADTRATLAGVALAGAILPPVLYSYWFWRRRGTRA